MEKELNKRKEEGRKVLRVGAKERKSDKTLKKREKVLETTPLLI